MSETTNHIPECAAMTAHLPEWLRICRCNVIAEAKAAIGKPRITFVGPVGKAVNISTRLSETPPRDTYATVKSMFG
jgi:hypothetical protein